MRQAVSTTPALFCACLTLACAAPATSMRVVLTSDSAVFVEQTSGSTTTVYRCGPGGEQCEPSNVPTLVAATRSVTQRAERARRSAANDWTIGAYERHPREGAWARALSSPPRLDGRTVAVRPVTPSHRERCDGCGWLSLASYPYCTLSIDGQEAGVTPVRRVSLAEGTHRLECETPVGTEVFDVVVRPGEHERLVIAVGD